MECADLSALCIAATCRSRAPSSIAPAGNRYSFNPLYHLPTTAEVIVGLIEIEIGIAIGIEDDAQPSRRKRIPSSRGTSGLQRRFRSRSRFRSRRKEIPTSGSTGRSYLAPARSRQPPSHTNPRHPPPTTIAVIDAQHLWSALTCQRFVLLRPVAVERPARSLPPATAIRSIRYIIYQPPLKSLLG